MLEHWAWGVLVGQHILLYLFQIHQTHVLPCSTTEAIGSCGARLHELSSRLTVTSGTYHHL